MTELKLHLDTDLGGDIDDLCALAMVLNWPDVNLMGVTTNSDDQGRRAGYTRYALKLAGRGIDEMKKISLIGTIVLMVLMVMSCQPSNPSPVPTRTPIKLETQNPHIRGQILNIYLSDGKVTGIMVQGTKEADTVYAEAIVGINSETHIYINSDGNFTDADSSLLEKGQAVEALFSGPIQTSDPVQASAIEIVILK